jgi:hypothetical protein
MPAPGHSIYLGERGQMGVDAPTRLHVKGNGPLLGSAFISETPDPSVSHEVL